MAGCPRENEETLSRNEDTRYAGEPGPSGVYILVPADDGPKELSDNRKDSRSA